VEKKFVVSFIYSDEKLEQIARYNHLTKEQLTDTVLAAWIFGRLLANGYDVETVTPIP
jgi:hypothetical protein